MIDKKKFFENVVKERLFLKLWPGQLDGMTAILNEWEKLGDTDVRKLAYMLATVYHETAYTMQPIEEKGKGAGRKYGNPDPVTGKIYYGRGFVQLTWKENYEKFGKVLKQDLLKQPELACDLVNATKILFLGMRNGWFTGRRLDNYIKESYCDFVQCRRIINGMDQAGKIADYATRFAVALNNSNGVTV